MAFSGLGQVKQPQKKLRACSETWFGKTKRENDGPSREGRLGVGRGTRPFEKENLVQKKGSSFVPEKKNKMQLEMKTNIVGTRVDGGSEKRG